ncbi:MAG TPA: hypothetical protein VH678_16785 [Xanthobacteraceae bacterium]
MAKELAVAGAHVIAVARSQHGLRNSRTSTMER